jgi:hypothetical protein
MELDSVVVLEVWVAGACSLTVVQEEREAMPAMAARPKRMVFIG